MKRAAFLLIAASLPACHRAKPPAQPAARVQYAFTHADGKPCPPLYVMRPGFFTERDGTHEDACAAAPGVAAKFALDELRGGESILLSIPVAPQPAPGRTRAVIQ